MDMFWLGFATGFLFLVGLLVVIALCGHSTEPEARRVAREVRKAKRQIDAIFTDTRRNMEHAKHIAPPKRWKED